MKTPEEWMEAWIGWGFDKEATYRLFREIQADALEEAAKIIEDDRKYSDAVNYRPSTYDLVDRIRTMKPEVKE